MNLRASWQRAENWSVALLCVGSCLWRYLYKKHSFSRLSHKEYSQIFLGFFP